MKNNCFIVFTMALMLGRIILCYGQELPPISNYSPADYKAENQNWDLSQSHDRTIYVANNKGLLEYDGEAWALHVPPNESILRAVFATESKVYTGCYMEFGYWIRDQFGALKYTSLSKELETPLIEDEEFWTIFQLDQWILFQSLNRIYIYDTELENFKIIDSEDTISHMFLAGNTVYYQVLGQGLYKLQNGEPLLVNSDPLVQNDVLINVLEVEKESLMAVFQDEGLYLLEGDRLEMAFDIKPYVSSSIYSALKLKNGLFAIGSIANGVFVFDQQGNLNYQISQQHGINNNTVLALFEDQDYNIWLGLDNGISCINTNAPIKEFEDSSGDLGSVYASIIYDDRLYLGTNQGLFYRALKSHDPFVFLEGTQGQVWTLKIYDDLLFCGHNFGTFIIQENRVQKISNVQGAWTLKNIPGDENLLLQGTYSGLYVLEKRAEQWSLRNKISGFDISSRFVEHYDDKWFVNHEYKGLYTLQIDSEYEQVLDIEIDATKRGHNSGLVRYKDALLYAYKEGVFKYNSELRTFEKDSTFSQNFSEATYISGKLVEGDQKLWTFTTTGINCFSPGKLSDKPVWSKIIFPQEARHSVIGYESLLKLDNSQYLLGSTNGFVLLDPYQKLETETEVLIQKVTTNSLEDDIKTSLNMTSNPEVPYTNNNIQFTFSAFDYSKYNGVQYQYRLKGFYEHWSPWSIQATKYFENLPHGDYTFEVRSKLGNGTSKPAAFSFVILRPWYLSTIALIGYFMGLLLLSYITNTLYRGYYKKQQKALLLQKQKEIELKEYEKEQERMRFKNEGLKQEIENKSRELAVSTMSLIKKNEFLSKLKKDLSGIEDINTIKNVVKTIDNSLNNEDDWEFFKKAFNNADKEFFKKLKSKHPSLTSNDLKLCAYLRLNLSSKEIASLLNISIRSTEVKRYRLRKKMNLPHEASLNNYIIEI